jgi:hypothetical protein
MKKIETLKLNFTSTQEFQQPLYCPLTGGLLVASDPFEEMDTYPPSVFAVFVVDYLDTPHYLKKNLDESEFSDLEDLEELKSVLAKKVSQDSGFLIIQVMYYGQMSGDAGGWIFFLDLPNI